MILNNDYVPEVETVLIMDRYQTHIESPFDINFESAVLKTEILKNKHYTTEELTAILKTKFPDVNIWRTNMSIQLHRRYMGGVETVITIYNEGVIFAPYILAETNEMVGNGNLNNLIAKGRYGNIEHGGIPTI